MGDSCLRVVACVSLVVPWLLALFTFKETQTAVLIAIPVEGAWFIILIFLWRSQKKPIHKGTYPGTYDFDSFEG